MVPELRNIQRWYGLQMLFCIFFFFFLFLGLVGLTIPMMMKWYWFEITSSFLCCSTSYRRDANVNGGFVPRLLEELARHIWLTVDARISRTSFARVSCCKTKLGLADRTAIQNASQKTNRCSCDSRCSTMRVAHRQLCRRALDRRLVGWNRNAQFCFIS